MRDQAFQVALIQTYSTPRSLPWWHMSDTWFKIHHHIAPNIGRHMSLSNTITTLVEIGGYYNKAASPTKSVPICF